MMPLNRNRIYSKNNKNAFSTLQNDLFSKINSVSSDIEPVRPLTTYGRTKTQNFYQQIQKKIRNNQIDEKPMSLLQKARFITSSKKQQIEKAKKNLKKSNKQVNGMFLTGCGLYNQEQQNKVEFNDDFQTVDMDSALKYLVSHENDDLEQLRRMIKKTDSNLKQYSHEVYKTKNEVVSAADAFGKQLNVDLRVKINKCKLEGISQKTEQGASNSRRLSTSHQNRSKIHSLTMQI